MAYYCSTSDVGSRLGLDSAQRSRASTRLTSAIRRATIEIDQMFRDYGRDVPSDHIAETTLASSANAGATTISLTDASSFSASGNGNVDGDSIAWTGKSGNDLTGVTGLSFSHSSSVTVQESEFAHVLREICADVAAAVYMEDESVFQGRESDKARGHTIRKRAMEHLRRLAHLGSVN